MVGWSSYTPQPVNVEIYPGGSLLTKILTHLSLQALILDEEGARVHPNVHPQSYRWSEKIAI